MSLIVEFLLPDLDESECTEAPEADEQRRIVVPRSEIERRRDAAVKRAIAKAHAHRNGRRQ